MSPSLALALVLSYLTGAVPCGVIAGRLRGIDVRSVGSGNIGATNVYRALGPAWGCTVFALDVLKGFAGPRFAHLLMAHPSAWVLAGCSALAVAGHSFSVFIGFKGGKGIATGLGALTGLMPVPMLACFAFWGVVLLLTRMIGAASIAACLAVPVAALASHQPPAFLLAASLVALLALVKHLPNLRRILAGTEPRLGDNSSPRPAGAAEASAAAATRGPAQ